VNRSSRMHDAELHWSGETGAPSILAMAGLRGQKTAILPGWPSGPPVVTESEKEQARGMVEAMGLPQGLSKVKGIDLLSRTWFKMNLESRMFYVPGVIALIGMLITLMLTSMAIVREKEVGTLEQLMVTPMRPVELILGKTHSLTQIEIDALTDG
jgi:hypothetical protein